MLGFADSQHILESTAKETRVVMSLNISKVQPKDYGMYKCFAQNAMGQGGATVRLYGEQHKPISAPRALLRLSRCHYP